MSDPSAIRAAKAQVEVGVDDGPLGPGLSKVQARFAATVKALQRAGTGMAMAGAAIGFPMILAAKSAATFQDRLLELQAATANLTPRQLAAVRAEAMRLSRSLGAAPEDVAAAFTSLVKAGMTVEETLGGAAKAAVEFAKVAGVDIETAAVLMKVSMRAFGTTAQETVDTLSAAADSSEASMAQIVEAFGQIGATGAMFDQSLFSISQGLAVLAGAMMTGEEAGTALKTFLLKIVAPAADAEAELRKFGLTMKSFRDDQGRLLELGDIVGVLSDALEGVPAEQWQASMAKVFDVRGVRVLAAFLQVGKAGFENMADAMVESKSVGDKYKDMMSGLSGSFTRMLSAVKRVGVAFGDSLTTPVWAASQAVKGISLALEGLFGYVPILGPLLAAGAAGFFGIGVAMSVAATAVTFATEGFVVFGGLLGKLTPLLAATALRLHAIGVAAVALPFIGPAFAAIGAAASAAAAGVSSLAAAVMAIPGVGWIAGIAAALAALGYVASKYFTQDTPTGAATAKTKRPEKRKPAGFMDYLMGTGEAAPQAQGAEGRPMAATFAGSIASQLGVGGPGNPNAQSVQERIAAATEKTAKNTEATKDNVPKLPETGHERPPGWKAAPEIDTFAFPMAAGPAPGAGAMFKPSAALPELGNLQGALASTAAAIRSAPAGVARGDRDLLTASERAANANEDAVTLLRQIHRAIVRGEGVQFA